MAITVDQLSAIVADIDDPAAPGLASQLRQRYPGLLFTVCSDDDVGEVPPITENPDFNLYLVDGSGHCLSLTRELDAAVGVVIAWKSTP